LLSILTLCIWGKIGRLTHYALDAVLISTILAGMRRTTGLTYVCFLLLFPGISVYRERFASIPYWARNNGLLLLTVPNFWSLDTSLKKDTLSEDKTIKNWLERYLGVGEWVMDQSVAIAGSSGWFERKH
ncbi:hypothetical protein Golomagni_04232, partial [Golovinomyces magnicellulatus]